MNVCNMSCMYVCHVCMYVMYVMYAYVCVHLDLYHKVCICMMYACTCRSNHSFLFIFLHLLAELEKMIESSHQVDQSHPVPSSLVTLC